MTSSWHPSKFALAVLLGSREVITVCSTCFVLAQPAVLNAIESSRSEMKRDHKDRTANESNGPFEALEEDL